MSSSVIAKPACRVVAETPSDHQHYFGFHDVSPWSPDDQWIAMLRVPNDMKATPLRNHEAEVCIWQPGTAAPQPVGTTHAFNWQQGARLQWIPGNSHTLMANDQQDGVPITRFYDLGRGEWSGRISAIYSVHPSGEFGLAPDWFRLGQWWRDYSYDLGKRPVSSVGDPGDLRRVDLAHGTEEIITSVAHVRKLCGQKDVASKNDFISHPTFSPNGSRFCFMYRRFSDDGALFSFFLACNSDGTDIRLLAREKCSHFDWIDENELVLWTRMLPGRAAAMRSSGWTKRFPFKQFISVVRKLNPRLKQSLFAEMYYRLDYRKPGEMRPFGRGVLEQDGHPMFTPDRKWMITDTYAFQGYQPLILYSPTRDERHDVMQFSVHSDFIDPALKCDLHPRLNRSGTKVCVDSAHTGMRQVYVVDIEKFLGASQ